MLFQPPGVPEASKETMGEGANTSGSNPQSGNGSGGILEPGLELAGGRFRLERVLGKGGMGTVWLAFDQRLKERVALKFLSDAVRRNAKALEAMRVETRRCHSLSHPHIVRIHDLYEEPGEAPFISMEYVEGSNLHELARERMGRRFAWAELEAWLREVGEALEHAHSRGVIHRDLKPANLMLDKQGTLKLADFGLAEVLAESNERGSVSGTVHYMSPQQLSGEPAGEADDVYSLGVTFFELMTGTPVFGRSSRARDICLQPAPLLAEAFGEGGEHLDVPEAIQDLIQQCLAKAPERRPSSVSALLKELEPTSKTSADAADVEAAVNEFSRHLMRKIGRVMIWFAGLIAALIAGALLWMKVSRVGPFETRALDLSKAQVWASSYSTEEALPHYPKSAFDRRGVTVNDNHYRWTSRPWSGDKVEWIAVDLGADMVIDWLSIDWESAFAADYEIRTRREDEGFDANPDNWATRGIVKGYGEHDVVGVNAKQHTDDVIFDFRRGLVRFPAWTAADEGRVTASTEPVRYVMLLASKRGPNPGVYSLYEIRIGAR